VVDVYLCQRSEYRLQLPRLVNPHEVGNLFLPSSARSLRGADTESGASTPAAVQTKASQSGIGKPRRGDFGTWPDLITSVPPVTPPKNYAKCPPSSDFSATTVIVSDSSIQRGLHTRVPKVIALPKQRLA
jgi:hypothetical protein